MWLTARHLVKRSCDRQEAELDLKIRKSALMTSSATEEVMSVTDSPKESHLNMVSGVFVAYSPLFDFLLHYASQIST